MSNIGSTGVEIFFLISGFVISASAFGETAARFAVKRAIRLLPALWICGLIALVARASLGEPFGELLVAFSKSAVLSPIGPYIDGVVWTLVVEAVFYACVGLCLLSTARFDIVGLAKMLGVFSGVFVSSMFLADHHAFGGQSGRMLAVMDRFPFKVLLLREGVFFSAGILIWSRFRTGRSFRRDLSLALVLTACTLELTIMRQGWSAVFSIGAWWLSCGALVASVIWSDRLSLVLGVLRRPVVAAGDFSYPLYLSHYTLGYVLVFQFSKAGLGRIATAASSLGIITMLSAVVALVLEPRVQALLRARWLGRQTAPGRRVVPPTAVS